MTTAKEKPIVLRDLGDGLILRRSSKEDTEALATFNATVHSDEGPEHPDEKVAAWTRDLLSGLHPTHRPDDFTIVEEIHSGRIISAMNLISQTWTYEGIPFNVGRPELVGTLPEYRKRGLVRLQFEEVHKWSAQRGELVQAITGIPYYYRQFGYEMGLDLGGGRAGFEPQLPKLPENENEPFLFRHAVEADIPFLMETAAHGAKRSIVNCPYDEIMWRYVLCGQSEKNDNRRKFLIIEQAKNGEPVGYLAHPWYPWGSGLMTNEFELKPGVSWLEVAPSATRYLWKTGGEMLIEQNRPRTAYTFWLGREHPVYEAMQDALPRIRQPEAWYLRVPDLAAFFKRIQSALEQRLASSLAVGYSGELRLDFYRNGLRLCFEKGSLTDIVTVNQPSPREFASARFPDQSFLHLVFGHLSLDDLQQVYPDCWYKDDTARCLLNILFPKRPSNPYGVV